MSNAKREDTFLNKEEKELKTKKMGEALPGLERVDRPWGYLLYTDLQSNRQATLSSDIVSKVRAWDHGLQIQEILHPSVRACASHANACAPTPPHPSLAEQ